MKKIIITSIIFITILLSACSIKENSIETLKPTEIKQKNYANYEVKTIDFNIGERNIDNIDYTLKGIISIPKQSKQKKLKLAIIVPGYYKDMKIQDKGFKYLTEYIAKNGYLGIYIDTDSAYYLDHTIDKEYENIPKIFDEHIKKLKEANEGHNIYNIDLENKIDFRHIAVISSTISQETMFKLSKEQSEKGVNILTLLLINPTNNKVNDFNIDNVKNISILISELDEEVIGLEGFSIYNILKKCKNQNILSLTLLKNANLKYFNTTIKSNDDQTLDIDLSNQISRAEEEKFLKKFIITYLNACFRNKYDNTIYDTKIPTVTRIDNLDVINYLQTSKNKDLKDIRKIDEFKGKNITFSIVETELPKIHNKVVELLNIKWEYKGGKLSFTPDINDFSKFDNITINTMLYPDNESNVKGRSQSICIELTDNKGKSKAVEVSKESNLISYPKCKLENLDFENEKEVIVLNKTTQMSNIRIPMVLYKDIDLKNIKKFNILLNKTNSGDLLFESIMLD
ncbi:hypothetical protein [Romboutsia ilealis]|uniref:hypothetical protein n=1 Tax=Romboutsia ilealis TaxID=1115758 RepID=UPI002572888C|nr:hypothetical protein [Romboutsia ilealis]